MTKVSKSEREEALARLHDWIKPGDTVYTILRHRSRSGMSREIGVVLLMEPLLVDPQHGGRAPVDIHPNHAVATVLGERLGKRDGVVVGGGGMDMGFHLVYSLSSTLYPDGFGCIGERCTSNDHSNGDRSYIPHACSLNGPHTDTIKHGEDSRHTCHWHRDGGYALRQRWL